MVRLFLYHTYLLIYHLNISNKFHAMIPMNPESLLGCSVATRVTTSLSVCASLKNELLNIYGDMGMGAGGF